MWHIPNNVHGFGVHTPTVHTVRIILASDSYNYIPSVQILFPNESIPGPSVIRFYSELRSSQENSENTKLELEPQIQYFEIRLRNQPYLVFRAQMMYSQDLGIVFIYPWNYKDLFHLWSEWFCVCFLFLRKHLTYSLLGSQLDRNCYFSLLFQNEGAIFVLF